MNRPLWKALAHSLGERGTATVLDDLAGRTLSAEALLDVTDSTARWLKATRATTVALPDTDPWMTNILQLAAWRAGLAVLVVPGFFSPEQQAHALHCAAPELILSPELATLAGSLTERAQKDRAPRPDTAVITFTSGSTSQPKGVCLGQQALLDVARSLAGAIGTTAAERHLSLLPPAVLLETVGGTIRTLLAGGRVLTPDRAAMGVADMTTVDGPTLLRSIAACQATSIITMPQVLTTLVQTLERDQLPAPAQLAFVGVGGAAIAPELLRRARRLQLPACEGYGLSECASVVCLNVPGASRVGSVGRPLPHARVILSPDGEVLVGGATLSATLEGEAALRADGLWATGDLGRFDDDGYLYLTGRKDNRFCTAYGRNLSPEWIEAELAAVAGVVQVVVLGDGLPAPVALVVADPAAASDLLARLKHAALALPAYARPGRWIFPAEPFSKTDGLWTANGRPRRRAIAAAFAQRLAPTTHSFSHSERAS